MKVAVPLEKHSWIFGQLASSQTVTSSRDLSFDLKDATALPEGRLHTDPWRFAQAGRTAIKLGGVAGHLVRAEFFGPCNTDRDTAGLVFHRDSSFHSQTADQRSLISL